MVVDRFIVTHINSVESSLKISRSVQEKNSTSADCEKLGKYNLLSRAIVQLRSANDVGQQWSPGINKYARC